MGKQSKIFLRLLMMMENLWKFFGGSTFEEVLYLSKLLLWRKILAWRILFHETAKKFMKHPGRYVLPQRLPSWKCSISCQESWTPEFPDGILENSRFLDRIPGFLWVSWRERGPTFERAKFEKTWSKIYLLSFEQHFSSKYLNNVSINRKSVFFRKKIRSWKLCCFRFSPILTMRDQVSLPFDPTWSAFKGIIYMNFCILRTSRSNREWSRKIVKYPGKSGTTSRKFWQNWGNYFEFPGRFPRLLNFLVKILDFLDNLQWSCKILVGFCQEIQEVKRWDVFKRTQGRLQKNAGTSQSILIKF